MLVDEWARCIFPLARYICTLISVSPYNFSSSKGTKCLLFRKLVATYVRMSKYLLASSRPCCLLIGILGEISLLHYAYSFCSERKIDKTIDGLRGLLALF